LQNDGKVPQGTYVVGRQEGLRESSAVHGGAGRGLPGPVIGADRGTPEVPPARP